MVRLILGMLLLLFGGGSAWAEAGGSPQITTAPGKDVDFDTAYAAHVRGDFDQAILFYDKVVRDGGISDWTTAVVLTNRGMAYLDKDQVDRAIADFDAAIKIEPDYGPGFRNRADAYYRKDELDRAIADYDDAIRLDPEDSYAFRHRGIVFYHQKKYDLAIADDRKAIALDSNYAEAYLDRGKARYQLDDTDQALADFAAAIRIRPEYALAYAWRGYVHDDARQYDEAVADYDRAIHLDPADADYLYDRGVAHEHQGDMERAVADYRRAVRLDPGLPKDWYQSAEDDLKAGRIDDAIFEFNAAIRLDPGLTRGPMPSGVAPTIGMMLSRTPLLISRRRCASIPAMPRSTSTAPGPMSKRGTSTWPSTTMTALCGWTRRPAVPSGSGAMPMTEEGEHGARHSRSRQSDRARSDRRPGSGLSRLELFRQGGIRAGDPGFRCGHSLGSNARRGSIPDRGNAHVRMKKWDEAISDYSAAIRIDPHDKIALRNRGLAYEEEGRTDQAIEDYDAAIAIDPRLCRGLCKPRHYL